MGKPGQTPLKKANATLRFPKLSISHRFQESGFATLTKSC